MEWLIGQLALYGTVFVFVNVFLEQVGAPIPAIPTLVVAGALAADGRLSAPACVASAMLAATLADMAWFAAGRARGRRVLRLLCRVSLSPDSCVRQTESFYERYGIPSLVFAKFVPGFSTVAPPLAGAMGTGFWRFLVFDAVGSLLWAALGIGAGMIFHRTVDAVLARLSDLGSTAALVLGAVLAAFVALKAWRRWAFFRRLRAQRIAPHDLHAQRLSGTEFVVFDVRSAAARRGDPRRVPGAVPLDPDRLEDAVAHLREDLEVVLYCT